jgi:putative NADH-flavin reductase
MTRIVVLGGTGYAGSHIVAEAVQRGHTVLSVARTLPSERVEGATYLEGTLLDIPSLVTELQGVEVVVSTVPARGDMLGLVRPAIAQLKSVLPDDVRLGVIGGAGGSLVADRGPRLIDTDGFADEYKPEAREAIEILEDLQADASGRDWFYVHPAGGFGVWAPGERTGSYRDGGPVLVTDADGESFISGADLAVAVLDEIEEPRHSRENFAVGY